MTIASETSMSCFSMTRAPSLCITVEAITLRSPNKAQRPRKEARLVSGAGLPDVIEISPRSGLATTVSVPGSKSLTNRALLIAGLADGESRLAGALESDDTRVMIAGLSACGAEVTTSATP